MAQKFDAKDRKEGTDYQIASMKNRIIRCTQGLFGSQSLIVATLVIHICERGYFGNPP